MTTKSKPAEQIAAASFTPDTIVAFGKANLAAMVEANKILAAGLKTLSEQAAAAAKTSYEDSVAAFKALTAVKTPKEAADLQASYAKAAFTGAVAETKKFADASVKLTEDAFAPLKARMTEVFAKAA